MNHNCFDSLFVVILSLVRACSPGCTWRCVHESPQGPWAEGSVQELLQSQLCAVEGNCLCCWWQPWGHYAWSMVSCIH